MAGVMLVWDLQCRLVVWCDCSELCRSCVLVDSHGLVVCAFISVGLECCGLYTGGCACACKEVLTCCAYAAAQRVVLAHESAEWAHPGVDKRFGEPYVSASCCDCLLDVFFPFSTRY